jgi:hypothetical protein
MVNVSTGDAVKDCPATINTRNNMPTGFGRRRSLGVTLRLARYSDDFTEGNVGSCSSVFLVSLFQSWVLSLHISSSYNLGNGSASDFALLRIVLIICFA